MTDIETKTKPGILSWIMCIMLAELIAFSITFSECVLVHKFNNIPYVPFIIPWSLTFLLGPGTLYWIVYYKLKKNDKLAAFILTVANTIFFCAMLFGTFINAFFSVMLYDIFAKEMLMLWS